MHIEGSASAGRITGDRATLVSPQLNLGGNNACLRMWYYLWGRDVDALVISEYRNGALFEVSRVSRCK